MGLFPMGMVYFPNTHFGGFSHHIVTGVKYYCHYRGMSFSPITIEYRIKTHSQSIAALPLKIKSLACIHVAR